MTATYEANILARLRQANIHRHAEWWVKDGCMERGEPIEVTLSFRGNEIAGEVGELCNVLKKMERARLGLKGAHADVEQAAQEIADVLICLDLIAMDIDVDLADAVQKKFNATSDKYGLRTRL